MMTSEYTIGNGHDSAGLSASANLPYSPAALPLKYVGHVNIVGECFCFGLATDYTTDTHRPFPIYMNLVGAATSVEAAWARLVQGKELTVARLERNAVPIYLYPPEKGLYVRVQRKLDGLGMDNLLLLHRQLIQPEFFEQEVAYILAIGGNTSCLRLADYISRIVKIAVFPAWGEYLRQKGQTTGLVVVRSSYEGANVWALKLDTQEWTSLICEGLQKGVLKFPQD